MEYAVGLVVALLVYLFAKSVGFDRDRSFYPTVLVIIASYYVLFAVMGGSTRSLVLELVGMGVFMVLAVIGFRRNLWLVVVAIGAHGVFDLFHARLVDNPGVPNWWPAFCMSADVGIAALLALARPNGQRVSTTR